MTIPWIYQIYKAVRSASEDSEGGGGVFGLEWTDLVRNPEG